LEARRKLVEKGYFSRLKMLEYEQLRIGQVKNIDIQMSNAAKARAAIAAIDSQIVELRRALLKVAATDLAEAGDNASLRTEEQRKSTQRKTFPTVATTRSRSELPPCRSNRAVPAFQPTTCCHPT
jgi:hemolysin D